ncbi:MAG: type II toxin-antitoxin system HicB family antitoxin [Gloeocapsa sp. DLM2.Bin57]|nr:MAG: type II toxin-antitoxin system HicB family antitoxin [Gloeocapsa sp. DLM2.Bin57]
MVDYNHYSYKVIWSSEDEEFVGLCVEFPSLSYLHENRQSALEGITDLVKDIVSDLEANGEKVPYPLTERTYSGKFQVRISPEIHRKLAIAAAEENISLNRYISNKLAG